MRVGAFELNEPLPELNQPQALALLKPWVDVGSVGTLVVRWLENHWGAKELGKLAKPGTFFDFTRYRPVIFFREGRREIAIPNVWLRYTQRESMPDFIFLHLKEPHAHGEFYVDSILKVLERLNVRGYILIGVLVSQKAAQRGIPTLSLIVHLPQYAQLEEDYTGAFRLLSLLSSLCGISPDFEGFRQKGAEQYRQVSLAVDANTQLSQVLRELEERYDAQETKKERGAEDPRLSPEVEKFLREIEKRFPQS